MTDIDAAGLSEDLDLIEEARAEYTERLSELKELDSPEFDDAADDLLAWANDVNADMNEACQELGEGQAVNTESLILLMQARANA